MKLIWRPVRICTILVLAVASMMAESRPSKETIDVPEPTSYLLIGAGLIGISLLGRGRRESES